MNEVPPADSDAVPLSVELRVDQVCVRFEAAWQAGQRPRIEEYLAGVEASERPVFLRELLLLDLDYRGKAGARPSAAEYHALFPEDAAVIDAVFRRRDGSALPPPTLPGTPSGSGPERTGSAADWPCIPGYEVLGELGRGGMGVVYKARHVRLKRSVALKMILGGALVGPEHLARFRTEAEAVARLQHPHIVQIYEVGEHNGLPFLALEFVDGGSLSAKLAGNPQEPAEAARVVETLAEAMHAAHQAGVLHRDLKPANVLLTTSGAPKVTDFGLAKQLDDPSGHTRSGVPMGTPSYMAPEQAAGEKDIGPGADVYALGAILYECLTGRPPFRGATLLDTLDQVRTQEPVSPRALQPKLSRDLETVCLKCLQKEPHRRYASAADLAEELRRFQVGEPILARPIPALTRALKWAKRRPAAAALAVVSSVGPVLVATGLLAALLVIANALEAEKRARTDLDKAYRAERAAAYRNSIIFADREWAARNLAHVDQLLDACPEQLRQWEWHHLKRRCQGLYIISNHTCAAFSPDGTQLATAGEDGTISLCDATRGHELLQLAHLQGSAHSLAYSPNGRWLATAAGGSRTQENGKEEAWGEVRVWDCRSGEEHLLIRDQKGQISAVAFSPDGSLLAAAGRGGVKTWDAETGKPSLSLDDASLAKHHLVFSPDGKRLAASDDGRNDFADALCQIWDLSTGKPVLRLKGGGNSLSFSPDSRFLAGADAGFLDGGETTLWDAITGQVKQVYRGMGDGVAFSPDGKQLAMTGVGGVKIVDVADPSSVLTFIGPLQPGGAQNLAFSPDGRRLAIGRETSPSGPASVKVLETKADQDARTLSGLGGWVAFGPRGDRLAVATIVPEGSPNVGARGLVLDAVKILDTTSGREVLTVKCDRVLTGIAGLSPDGCRLATENLEEPFEIRLWDIGTGKQLLALPDGRKPVAFSPDGRQIACQVEQGVRIWDALTGQEVRTFGVSCKRVAFTPNGQLLVATSAGSPSRLMVWDVTDGRELLTVDAGEWGEALAVSPDGKVVAVGNLVFDLATGNRIQTLRGTVENIFSLAFSSDGQRLVSGSGFPLSLDIPGQVKVWDVATGEEMLALRGHCSFVLSVAFSPDGKWVASGSLTEVKIWDGRPPGETTHGETTPNVPAPLEREVGPLRSQLANPVDGGGVKAVVVSLENGDEPDLERWAKKAPKDIRNTIGMELVLIPAGKFTMGSPKEEEVGKSYFPSFGGPETQHEVEISRAFYMGAYEVTQQQYEAVMGRNPSYFSRTREGKEEVKDQNTGVFPVEMVSWDDAVEFCKRLSDLPGENRRGRVYRLPTEAEWEYACRGGASSQQYAAFYFGNSLSWEQANFNGEAPFGNAPRGPRSLRTTKVGSYQRNGFGLYDMHGNVWEWCADWYGREFYTSEDARKDPWNDRPGSGQRVMRGGSWGCSGYWCRSGYRWGFAPNGRSNQIGFRVVCGPRTR
jgi:formylglycine-generating enzyme required for sulfatase activity/WD40 repeat protein